MSEPQFIVTDPNYYLVLMIQKYQELTGRTLNPADPERLMINLMAYGMGLMAVGINEAGKQNLLSYASGGNLDLLGELVGITRLPAAAAEVTLQITLPTGFFTTYPQYGSSITIPAGLQVTTGSLIFQTLADITLTSAALSATVTAQCTTSGIIGNGFVIGQINTFVDTLEYIGIAVTNTDTSSGGSDAEADDTFRARIRQKLEAFSVAGPVGAYKYWAQTASASVGDVSVQSLNPGEVDIYFLLQDGSIPSPEMIALVLGTVNGTQVRPLTDHVIVAAPNQVAYAINIQWWVAKDYENLLTSITSDVAAAVAAYVSWQEGTIGRDINPSVLIDKVMNVTGVKRVSVTTPVFQTIDMTQVAKNSGITVTYSGIEND